LGVDSVYGDIRLWNFLIWACVILFTELSILKACLLAKPTCSLTMYRGGNLSTGI